MFSRPKTPTLPRPVLPPPPLLAPTPPTQASQVSTLIGGTRPGVPKEQVQLLSSMRRRPDQTRDRRTLLGG
jgi:hypothetical protein